MGRNEKNGTAQSSHSLNDVKQDAELHGLTAALETLNSSVEEKFREELSRFERKWTAIEDVKSTEELFSNRCIEFLEKLSRVRGGEDQANEIAVALYHPSFQTDFSRVYRRAGLSGNVRSMPSPTAGKALIDLILSLYLLETKWVENKSVGAFANACNYLGSYALTERFWVDKQLGTPLVGRGFTEEKGLLDKAYKKLVHALFLYEGFFKAKEFVLTSLDPKNFLETFAEDIEFGDAKTLLQEYAQDLGLQLPSYQYKRDPNTPDHDPIFHVSLQLSRIGEVSVSAKSKKEGSKKLAETAIIALKRHKESRKSLMRLLAKKSASVEKEKKPISTRSIPQEVFDLANEVNKELGLQPDYFRLMQALKTKSAGRSRYNRMPDNEITSRIGALALEFSIINSDSEFRSLSVEGVHPRICDAAIERFQLRKLSRSIYEPIHDWGVNADRQMAQALLFALFINEQDKFFGKMKAWLRVQSVFSETAGRPDGDRRLPEQFDEKFSYVTVLQEYVQQKSPVLPMYSKITSGPIHAATHTAICEYEGNSTRASSSRFVWAKNTAAFKMLQKLGILEASS